MHIALHESLASTAQEQARLEALRGLELLDTAAEPEFDDLVALAAAICGVPMSMISLIDADRQWFKAARGTDVRETPRDAAFCNHVIRQEGVFVVADARADARFAQNVLVTGETAWRFYAGFPLRVGDGHAIGTLCVVDRQPREMSDQQREALRILADQVIARLELRTKRRELEEVMRAKEEAHQESRRVERRFASFMDSGPFIGYMKDASGRMLYYNQPLATRFGVTREAMLGKTDAELWAPDLAHAFREHDLKVLASGKQIVTQERTRNEDGSYTTWQSYKFPCESGDGQTVLGGVSLDITDQLKREHDLVHMQRELTQVNMLLQQLATTDTLTGLPLRRVFDERLRTVFREARRAQQPLCVLMIDVDNFKRHNDTFGHQHGDAVLKALADCLMEQLRPSDFITRFGGEEFAIAAPETPLAGAQTLAQRLSEAVRHLRVDGQSITASIGVAESENGGNAHGLIARADLALLAAKRDGKNRVVCWSDVPVQSIAAVS